MEQNHLEILLEDIRTKFDLVLEGHAAGSGKIDANHAETKEQHAHTSFQFKTLNAKIDAIAKELAAHRADSEAHPRFQVREPTP